MPEGSLIRLKSERDRLRDASKCLDEASANVSGALRADNWALVEQCIEESLRHLCIAAYPLEKLLARAREGLRTPG